ncbi:MAG: hypothetical protein NTU80_00160 [Verrucomicrobia bacterium]|nr:hypothetical protein [Verrucomicrobiota bacterium]
MEKRLAENGRMRRCWAMDLFMGVDAGGTKTRAVIADVTGRVCGTGEAGPGNWQAVGAAAAGAAIYAAVGQALMEAGAKAAAVRGSFFGLAGVRTVEERALVKAELRRLALGGVSEIGGDLEVAHAGALAGGIGVVIIAGTGSAAWGKNAQGESAQAGGWGWLVDDAGGGYWLALRGLRAACEAEDGRGKATGLGARAREYFGVPGLREVLQELHAGGRDRAAVAGFAREVRAAARAGDAVAEQCVRAASAELLRMAEAVRARLSPDMAAMNFPLAVTGGLGMGEVVAEDALRKGFFPVEPWAESVLGAVLLAARAGGVVWGAAERVLLTSPGGGT